MVPKKEIEEKVSNSNANVKSSLRQYRDNLDVKYTDESYNGQSRITRNSNQSSSK